MWHVYTVPILGLCNIYIYKASEGYSDKKKHPLCVIYIYNVIVFKLELSILL